MFFRVSLPLHALSPQPFDLSQLAHLPHHCRSLPIMEHESPDWDRTPSVEIETKDEPLETTQIMAKTETSSTKDIKFEDAKKEEDSPSPTTLLCPPVSSLPDTSTPPAKAPPIPHASYRNLPFQHRHHPRHHPQAVRTPSSSPPTFLSCPKHGLATRHSTPPG